MRRTHPETSLVQCTCAIPSIIVVVSCNLKLLLTQFQQWQKLDIELHYWITSFAMLFHGPKRHGTCAWLDRSIRYWLNDRSNMKQNTMYCRCICGCVYINIQIAHLWYIYLHLHHLKSKIIQLHRLLVADAKALLWRTRSSQGTSWVGSKTQPQTVVLPCVIFIHRQWPKRKTSQNNYSLRVLDLGVLCILAQGGCTTSPTLCELNSKAAVGGVVDPPWAKMQRSRNENSVYFFTVDIAAPQVCFWGAHYTYILYNNI